MKWIIAYAVCPALTLVILWLKQGRFLAWDVQPFGVILLGPIGPLFALLVPRSMLTSKEKSEGR
jgi:hypothetical protein